MPTSVMMTYPSSKLENAGDMHVVTPFDQTNTALAEAVLAHSREIPARLEALLAIAQEHPRGHAARALMLVTLARSELKPAALSAAQKATQLITHGGFSRADHAFAEAGMHAATGDWRSAIDSLETVLRLDPSDSLSAKLSHGLRFMLGDKQGMLRSIASVLRALPARHPHRGFLMGCHAFALEENGKYHEAESMGRAAVMLESRDAWGLHAVSHVHEMSGRIDEGIDWIETRSAAIRGCNTFGGHLFWHLALFRLEQGDITEVLRLYDREIRQEKTDDVRDIANGASLLARLETEGHGVGNRWEELAEKAEARIADRALVFADLHYMLALLGAGRVAAASSLAQSIAEAPAAYKVQDGVAQATGALMAEGLVHAKTGRADLAFRALRLAAPSATLLGGSDAQRDVFTQVLLEAALGSGETHYAEAMLNARLAARGGQNSFAATRLARIARRMPKPAGRIAVLGALAFARAAPHHG